MLAVVQAATAAATAASSGVPQVTLHGPLPSRPPLKVTDVELTTEAIVVVTPLTIELPFAAHPMFLPTSPAVVKLQSVQVNPGAVPFPFGLYFALPRAPNVLTLNTGPKVLLLPGLTHVVQLFPLTA